MEEFNPSSRKKDKDNGKEIAEAIGDLALEMNKLNSILDKMLAFVQEVDSCPNCNPSYDSLIKKLSGLCPIHSKLQQVLGF